MKNPNPTPKPLRIELDKRPTNYNEPMHTQRWFVSTRERDYRGVGRNQIEFATYQLEIEYNGITGPFGRIRYLAHQDGEEFEMMLDNDYEERVQAIWEHDDDFEDVDGIREHLADRNIWPESSMKTFGFNTTYFHRMVEGWKSMLQFIDLQYTL